MDHLVGPFIYRQKHRRKPSQSKPSVIMSSCLSFSIIKNKKKWLFLKYFCIYAKLAKFLGIANEGLVWVEVWFIIKRIGAWIWSICYVLFTVLWGWSMNDLYTFEFRWEVVCCVCIHWNLWKPTCGTSKIFVIIVHCYNNFVLKTWGLGWGLLIV